MSNCRGSSSSTGSRAEPWRQRRRSYDALPRTMSSSTRKAFYETIGETRERLALDDAVDLEQLRLARKLYPCLGQYWH